MTDARAATEARAARASQLGLRAKPTVESLGVDLSAQDWQRSGTGPGAIEVAVLGSDGAEWVLMRVCGDPAGRVLVYDRHEWECFLDGVRGGEFDSTAS